MNNKKLITDFLAALRQDLVTDLKEKRISEGDLHMRTVANDQEGSLAGDSHWYYLWKGRRPGKQPPPEKILAWIQRNGMHASGISDESLAYLIGRKIGKVGTDIYTGKRPGIAFDQIVKHNNEQFAGELKEGYLTEFKELFSADLKLIFS